jgi:O-antigen/teichoic acid export membrane protein
MAAGSARSAAGRVWGQAAAQRERASPDWKHSWKSMSNTRTIAKNSGWYGLDLIVAAVVAIFSSIAINRYLGPDKNSYIVYVSYVASLVSSLGGFGIPATTRKYMAEFIGMGDRGTARYIFIRTLLLQTGLATLATGGFLYWVLGDANPDYKLAAALLVLSIWPSMVNAIPAQANTATEDLSTNLPASVVSALVLFAAITATVVFHWGVVGVGASVLTMRTVDLLVRFFPTLKRVLAWETTHAHPPGLRKRMIAFAWPSVASMAVAMIVWGRSEILLLEHLCADIRQVSFYSLAFTMAEQLLLAATIFGAAASTTIFVQYGRDKSRLPAMTASTFRYLALISIPLHFVAASLAVPALLLLYGRQFQDAAMVVTLAPLLCIFRAYISPAQSLLQCSERQSFVIAATVLAGVVDWGVAWWFIPGHGAVGACIGNGAAQATAVLLMWAVAMYLYKVKLPWMQVAKIAFISALASLTAHFIAMRLAPLWGILCGGSASLVVLFVLFYLLRVLEPEDHDRFNILTAMLPKSIAAPVNKALLLLIRPAFGGAV